MPTLVESICEKENLPITSCSPVSGGQINQVFLINDSFILRIGGRADAFQRLSRETSILRLLAPLIPAPQVTAFNTFENYTYQIQTYLRGEKLYKVWTSFTPLEKDRLIQALAAHLRKIHAIQYPTCGYPFDPLDQALSWPGYFDALFHRTLAEYESHRLPFPPELLEDVKDFYAQNKSLIADRPASLIHCDLWPGNLLVHEGQISAFLDFEYAMAAPKEYELVVMEQFCLYPNDYAEEGFEKFNVGDFADYLQRLRRAYPELFSVPHLRQQLDLYHIEHGLRDFLEWGKDRARISPAARVHPVARVSNFLFAHGARLF